jgi:protein-disulfide isomerase
MPKERFFGFIKTLYANQQGWLTARDPEATLEQYAKLAGLAPERVTSCLADKKLQDALVQRRLEASNKYNITGTPSFIVNYGEGMITGASTFEDFDAALKKYVK